MTVTFWKGLGLALVLVGASLPLSAQPDDTNPEVRIAPKDSRLPHFGASIGVSTVEGWRDPATNFSLEIGYQPVIPFSLSAKYFFADFSVDVPGGRLVRNAILVEGAYNFGGTIPIIKHSYIGAAVGPVLEDKDFNDSIALGFRPNVGFDFPISEISQISRLTIGVNVATLIVNSDNPDELHAMGVVKYWY